MSEETLIKIDNLKGESETIRADFNPNVKIIKELHKQSRKDKHETVKHFLAGTIILSYIFLLIVSSFLKFDIPKAYETMALIVIGYYFAKYLI